MRFEDKLLQKTVTDFSGFQSLKNAAKNDDPEAAKIVAKQFEALFLQMMLKSMRDATDAVAFGDSLFKSDEEDYYIEMFDKQLAMNIADSQGIGLAEIIEKQLTKNVEKAPDVSLALMPIQETISNVRAALKKVPVSSEVKEETYKDVSVKQTNTTADTPKDDLFTFSTPQEFIKKLMPLAKEFAEKLGIKPQIMLAQAALETGWGKTLGSANSTKTFNNLFGIKATPDWKGDVAIKNTLEVEGGSVLKKAEPFRMYETIRESFEDYVAFLKGNQRYHDVLKKSGDPKEFITALHEAGYATDPQYAKKILKIYEKID